MSTLSARIVSLSFALSRAVCLKNLGRITEYEREKTKVPAGTTILIDGVNWRVEDL